MPGGFLRSRPAAATGLCENGFVVVTDQFPGKYAIDHEHPRTEAERRVRKQRVAQYFCHIALRERICSVAPLHTSFSADSSHDYVYGPSGVPIEQVNESTGAPTYLYTDQLGSVVMEADLSGSVIGTQSYSAYGSLDSSTGTDSTPFGFAGGYTDATGLIYLINRYYDPATGQFVSVDPLLTISEISPEAKLGVTAYSYAGGDPINFDDPSGQSPTLICTELAASTSPTKQDCVYLINQLNSILGNGHNPA